MSDFTENFDFWSKSSDLSHFFSSKITRKWCTKEPTRFNLKELIFFATPYCTYKRKEKFWLRHCLFPFSLSNAISHNLSNAFWTTYSTILLITISESFPHLCVQSLKLHFKSPNVKFLFTHEPKERLKNLLIFCSESNIIEPCDNINIELPTFHGNFLNKINTKHSFMIVFLNFSHQYYPKIVKINQFQSKVTFINYRHQQI